MPDKTFDQMPAELASKFVTVGQRLARRMKKIYGLEQVAFVFTGSDVAHVHAHVIPMHEKTDMTSARHRHPFLLFSSIMCQGQYVGP